MRANLLFTLALLLSAGPVLAQAPERTVYASVVDKSDAPVTGMAIGEFVVREDDAAREVLRVSKATEPLQIAVLIDTSQAMEEHMLDVRTAVRAFFKQMGGKQHDIALIGLGERPTVLSDYTRDPARLEKAVGSVFSRSGRLSRRLRDCSSGRRRVPTSSSMPRKVLSSASGPISRCSKRCASPAPLFTP
jgi:hypothetical protein